MKPQWNSRYCKECKYNHFGTLCIPGDDKMLKCCGHLQRDHRERGCDFSVGMLTCICTITRHRKE